MTVRKLSLVLDLDSGRFSSRVTDAAGKLTNLQNASEGASQRIDKVGRSAKQSQDMIGGMNAAVWKLQLTLMSVTFVFGGFTTGLIKMNAEAQRSMALLEGLSKKTEQAGRRADAAADFKFLREFAANAPFSLDALTHTFVKLKASGIDPTNGSMKALVDGVASFGGTNEVLERATMAIAQMAGKGTVSMEELRQQLGEAMPTALKIMAKAAGKSVGEFVDEVSKGNVTWKSIQDKFFKELQAQSMGASERLMNTFTGQMARAKTNMQSLALAVGGFQADGSFAKGGFMDQLTNSAKDLNTWLANPATLQGAREFGTTLANLLTGLTSFVSFVGSNLGTIKLLAEAFIAFKAVEFAVTGIRSFTSAVGLVNGRMGQLTQGSVAAKIAQVNYNTALRDGNLIVGQSKVAVAAKAEAAAKAAAAEKLAIEANVAALKKEMAQIVANTEALNAQRVAAAAAQKQIAANEAAGFARTRVGAGNLSAPTGSAAANTLLISETSKNQAAEMRKAAVVAKELEAAENALSAASVTAAARQAEMTVAMRAATIAAKAGAVAAGAFSTVLQFMGGPIIGGALVALGALAFVIGDTNKRLKEGEKAQKDTADAVTNANKAIYQAQLLYSDLDQVTGQTKKATDAFAEAQKTVKGDIRGVSEELVIQAEAYRKVQVEALKAAKSEIQLNIVKAQGRMVTSDELPKVRRQLRDPVGEPGARSAAAGRAAAGVPSSDQVAATMASRGDAYIGGLNKVLENTDKAIKALINAPTISLAKNIALPETESPYVKPKKGGSGGKSESASSQLEDEIGKLGANKRALDALIETLDVGSKAAEQMRAKIAELRDDGKTISADQESRAVEAARSAALLKAAYDDAVRIIDTNRESTKAAAEAFELMDEGASKVESGLSRFNQKLDLTRDEMVRFDPTLTQTAAGLERLAKMDALIADAKTANRVRALADAIRNLKEETEAFLAVSEDPLARTWDGLNQSLKTIEDQRSSAMKLDEGPQRDKILAELDKAKAAKEREAVRDVTERMDEETRAIQASLMTREQAAIYAHNREIDRLQTQLQAFRGTESEKARLAVSTNEAIAASNAQLQRELETPAQRMVREWSDATSVMKQLQEGWMNDFIDGLRDGSMSFEDFAIKLVEDTLWAIAKAKIAAAMQPAMDGMMNLATSFMSSIIPGLGGGSGSLGAFSVSDAGPVFGGGTMGNAPHILSVGQHHTGGIAGSPRVNRSVPSEAFINAPRYHSGGIAGLKANEVAAVLERGEGIFTKEQMKALGGGQTAPNVQVNVINESGQPMEAEQQGGGYFSGEDFIVNVVVDALNRPGKLRSAVKGS